MGSKPIHVMTPEERKTLPKISDYFIDLGRSKKEVDEYIDIGNPITREREFLEMGDCINCKSIDNRISVYILLEVLKRTKSSPHDVYGIFTVQEELGMRGAGIPAHNIDPDFSITLDTTIAYDVPGAQAHEKVTSLGKGAAIKIMDASVVCDSRMVAFLKNIAETHKIPWQPEVLTVGGTDTAVIQKMGKTGIISGAISIPTRHLHQVIEMANKADVLNCIDLLSASLQEIDQWNWKY